MSVPETWTEHTTANLERSQAARAASRKIRNDIEHCLNASTTSIREFWGASCLNISQRAQETMEARNQLQTKLSKVSPIYTEKANLRMKNFLLSILVIKRRAL